MQPPAYNRPSEIGLLLSFYLAAGGEGLDSGEGDLIVGLDLVVVHGVGESEREHALLLQVRLVNSRERLYNDSATTEMATKS